MHEPFGRCRPRRLRRVRGCRIRRRHRPQGGYYVIGIADRTSAADEPEMRRICSQFVPRWDMLDWTRV